MFPTTTVSIFRASGGVDEFGDDTDDNRVAIADDVWAAVVEDGQQRFAPADLRAELVEQFTVRVPYDTDVAEGDRLVDDGTGAVYQVTGVSAPQSLVGPSSIRLITKRVDYQP